ncbi:glycosyl hydrolase family 28-related protein [Herbivorax sp. ANBcel31]|uniref:glycosyl hydrolase family 28-related protein n=1 Tax=Herbivorax sp. ANBcel31 TaxID=3069754 RepID=UPI0027B2654F|nr:glycosyl hydrolase family 28-related protein [Herbivorax sp. ANBcel31]MDQ2086996.1 glycosyl hydrolase family 28-related protein [Herbivorax sp. ANBcel31]
MKKCLFILLISFLLTGTNLVVGMNEVDQYIWNAGIEGGIPDIPNTVNVLDFGAKGDGITDDYEAFNAAISSVSDGGAIFIPEGKYLIKSKLSFSKPVVLRGEGPNRTQLLIDHSQNAFEIITYRRGTWTNITKGHTKGSNHLEVENPELFEKGQYVEIQEDNNSDVMYTLTDWNTGWASEAVGQIAKVVSVEENTVIIDEPLRHNYSKHLNPVIRTQGFAEYVGFEDFSVERVDRSSTSIFYFKNAANCWIRNVHSMLARKCHVYVNTGYRIEIRDSFFDDATYWGSGGYGYGVQLGFHTTNCLIENNIFKHLRHSMMVQLGANGNVFGYNYSIEPYQSGGGNWIPADISLHGHYPYANLFEGNIVQKITVSDFWGPSGPGNTFLRNRVETETIRVEDSSNYQNFIGNELLNDDILWDTDRRFPHTIDPSTLLRHGNYINGSIVWDENIDEQTIPKSYYHETKPSFYKSMDWPSLGGDMLNGTNPAKERYLNQDILYGDLNGDNLVDSTDCVLLGRYLLEIISEFPNPDGINAADVNRDGVIDTNDYVLLSRYVLDIVDEL